MARLVHSFVLAVAICALALTLGGCGSGGTTANRAATETTATTGALGAALPRDAYDRRMRQLGHRLAVSVDSLFPLVEAQPGTDVSKETVGKLQQTRSVVTSVATDVSSISPPAPVRAAHEHLLNGLTTFGTELDELIRVLQKGTTHPFGEYTKFNGLLAIARATKEIERKGYAIGS